HKDDNTCKRRRLFPLVPIACIVAAVPGGLRDNLGGNTCERACEITRTVCHYGHTSDPTRALCGDSGGSRAWRRNDDPTAGEGGLARRDCPSWESRVRGHTALWSAVDYQ